MKKAFSISLIVLLIVSTIGFHFDYAKCTMTEEQTICSIISDESCCNQIIEDDCCSTFQIEQDGTFYDFVVGQSYKISVPAKLITNIQLASWIELVETTTLNPVSKPLPISIKNQAVFQVFLC